jgi:nitroimidazol reductase NimA-like FMN-containing flavoprotein (pyridoxamine 5'-phosphate oxidase superfamily)
MPEMSEEESVEILKLSMIGHLSLAINNLPYAVPVCYSYMDDKLYFNLLSPGKKIEHLKTNPRVCFVVAEWEDDGSWRSVIVYGTARLFQDSELSLKILENFEGTLDFEALIGEAEENVSAETLLERDFFICEIEIEKITGRKSTALLEA